MKETFQNLNLLVLLFAAFLSNAQSAQNPIIFADVPDAAMIRVGNTYYMSSTTMHMSPGSDLHIN